MLDKDLLLETVSAIDSLQQDYGTFRYSATVRSYASSVRLVVHIDYFYQYNEKSRSKCVDYAIKDADRGRVISVLDIKSRELQKYVSQI